MIHMMVFGILYLFNMKRVADLYCAQKAAKEDNLIRSGKTPLLIFMFHQMNRNRYFCGYVFFLTNWVMAKPGKTGPVVVYQSKHRANESFL